MCRSGSPPDHDGSPAAETFRILRCFVRTAAAGGGAAGTASGEACTVYRGFRHTTWRTGRSSSRQVPTHWDVIGCANARPGLPVQAAGTLELDVRHGAAAFLRRSHALDAGHRAVHGRSPLWIDPPVDRSKPTATGHGAQRVAGCSPLPAESPLAAALNERVQRGSCPSDAGARRCM